MEGGDLKCAFVNVVASAVVLFAVAVALASVGPFVLNASVTAGEM